ncbi:phage shock protein E [Sinobacterium caligoides]|uniref:Phage shock protein E n=1 Tax=Sinobacterium caligoides TaxID=933926 RepID=A0A3N2DYG9_9GAMM|nr:rhodanese-like domain-containing protein [Sinobacterium caligoides]ROS04868.1 phage shock protein E [Sinobacterium caligoides]
MAKLLAFIIGCCLVSQAAVAERIIIDVRTSEEYQAGHLDAAVNVPYDVIAKHIAELADDKNTEIVLYCRSGRRSGVALETLRGLGYVDVTNVGGYEGAKSWAREQE